jgi:RHH-type proline utilization regulon transcriptional repressor/proline dehydrogenase/delta 1-pyrroline-5-carboxylate dehydrogenase
VLCMATTNAAMAAQVGAALATGNVALVVPPPDPNNFLSRLPAALKPHVRRVADPLAEPCDTVLFDTGHADALLHWQSVFAARPGEVVPFHVPDPTTGEYDLAWLMHERAVSTNTAAAGGNASLMAIG